MNNTNSKSILILIGLLAVAVLTGCGKTADSPETPAFAVEKHYQEGAVDLYLRLAKDEITVAEKTTLTIEAFAASGFTVTLPELEMPIDTLQVADSASPPPSLENSGRTRHVKTFTLKPFLPGEYEIPGLTITVSRSRNEIKPSNPSSKPSRFISG